MTSHTPQTSDDRLREAAQNYAQDYTIWQKYGDESDKDDIDLLDEFMAIIKAELGAALIREYDHIAIINGEIGLEFLGERYPDKEILTVDERLAELRNHFGIDGKRVDNILHHDVIDEKIDFLRTSVKKEKS